MTAVRRRPLALLALLAAFLVAVLAVAPAPRAAETAAPPPVAAAPGEQDKAPPEEVAQKKLAAWKIEIEQISAAMSRQGMTDRELESTRQRADQFRQNAQTLVAEQTPRLAAIQARLKQLGAAPKADDANAAAEADSVRDERRAQEAIAAELDAVIKGAGVIQLQAEEIISAIAAERRDRFSRTLFAKTSSILDPTLWLDAAIALPRALNSATLLVSDWVRLLADRATDSAWAALLVVISVVVVLLSPIRRRLAAAIDRDAEVTDPPPLRRGLAAAAIVALNVGLPLAGLLIVLWTLRILELSPDRIDQTLGAVVRATTALTGLTGLSFALLAPAKPHWRMVAVGDAAAHDLNRLIVTLAAVHAASGFAVEFAAALVAPIAIQVVLSGVTALVDVSLVMLILRTLASALGERPAEKDDDAAAETAGSGGLWRWLLPLTWLTAITTVLAALVGYVVLARFLVTELVWAGAILAVLYVVLVVIDRAIATLVEPGSRTSDTLIRTMGMTRPTVEQFGVVLSGLLRVAAIVGAFVVVSGPLGVSIIDIEAFARQIFFGISLGGLTISLSAFLVGIVVFVVMLALTRTGQRWLEDSFLPRTQLDAGLKNSIRTAFGYAGFVLAAIVGLSSAGINLSNVAIVAGALSVGIGFGLQSIVNNFVSGLILLVERPMKTGDLVEVAGDKGIVRKINVRSTEIETFDRASLIVPNSSVISGNVKNWMHRDQSGRSLVVINLSYDADPAKVKEIMLACAADHPLALIFPAPACFLTALDTETMRFQLTCTVAKVGDAFGVESDLRFAILRRLGEAGIEIGQPTRSIAVDGLAEAVGRLGAVAAPATPAEAVGAEASKPAAADAAAPNPNAPNPNAPNPNAPNPIVQDS